MADKIKLDKKYELKENYDPSDSEDGYSEDDKEILSRVRNDANSDSDSNEEVYGFSESDKDEDDVADSDIEGKEESGDDLPDQKAWGAKKRSFYDTDYVDQDFGGFGNDEEAATLEEQEARVIQKRLTEQMNEDDFSFEFVSSATNDKTEDNEAEILIKTDLSQMSQRQKLQLLRKESPEFSGLVSDFKEKMAIANDYLKPIIKLKKAKSLPNCTALQFVEMYYEIVLNYCTNISFYLLLKAKKISIQNHPITKRLLQYKQMLKQIEPVYRDSIQSQIDKIMTAVKNKDIIEKICNSGSDKRKEIDNSVLPADELIEFDANSELPSQIDNVIVEEGADKRAITYEMAKNKGLTPHRKKEQRNPRVKHRNKYRKAKIRRKGAVREVRTEIKRYEGEISGIKSNVKKSIKIK